MRIKSIACTQFAGLRDRKRELGGGVNVIFGKNEDGKTTLVSLLCGTLFQSAKIDNRRDKDFKRRAFPGRRKDGGPVGDFADGTVVLETDRGLLTMTKEWGARGVCSLSTPEGVLRDEEKVGAALREAMGYGEGVYAGMLLSSQRDMEPALQALLDSRDDGEAKRELAAVATRAFAESGGVSLDRMERAIEGKVEEIAGKHWDAEKNRPAPSRAGRWSKDLGSILRAYYRWEDAQEAQREAARLENEADRWSAAYAGAEKEFLLAKEAWERFGAYAGRLEVQNERREAARRLEEDLAKVRGVLADWPRREAQLERARALAGEALARRTLDRFLSAKKAAENLEALRAREAQAPCPTGEEWERVRAGERRIAALEDRLRGMNLSAALNLLGGHQAQVKLLRTGELLPLTGEPLSLTEAVEISIPGVMELRLSPADVDAAGVRAQLEAQRPVVAGILEKYGVKTSAALEALMKARDQLSRQTEAAALSLERALNGEDYRALEAMAANADTTARGREEIEGDLAALCGGQEPGAFIAARETVLEGYRGEYGSPEALRDRSLDLAERLEKARAALGEGEDIPGEFLSVADPQAHRKRLEEEKDQKDAARGRALAGKTQAATRLEAYKESLGEDPAALVEEAGRLFEEQRELLGHWLHIREVFLRRKEALSGNPMEGLAARFGGYLARMTGGRVESEFSRPDRVEVSLYSGGRAVDYGTLSQGTKEAVSLAFRLAAVEQLFPGGGGVVVLDDPLVNMDRERTERACELIKEVGERHQVIFLTCKEEYEGMLKQ